MSGDANSTTALLTEHLRYTPVSLIDDVINSINTIGSKAVDWVEKGLLSTPLSNLGFSDPTSSEGKQDSGDIESQVRHEIENGVHQFETLLEATIDKNFDKMEIFALRSLIAIPDDLKDWIRLRHYEGLNLNPSLTPDAPTLDSITMQRRKHQESLRLQRLLQAEAARNNALISQLKSVISPAPDRPSSSQRGAKQGQQPRDENTAGEKDDHDDHGADAPPALAFLARKGDLANSSVATPLGTTTAFALSQLPAMKALLTDLRPSLAALAAGRRSHDPDPNLSAAAQEDQKSWRRQRLEYVEAQTRRLLENVRGLELGLQGRVADGEWQEEGRRLAGGEVEALERVVALVAGGEPHDSDRMEEGA